MTNEEIIKGLQAVNEHIGKHFNEGGAWMAEFIDEAIKALEQQPCEDAISRKAVVNWLEVCTDDSIEHAIESNLEFIPSVTPQPKRGKWKRVVDKTGHWVWECDDCEWQQRFATNYCPDCGADMRGDSDEVDN